MPSMAGLAALQVGRLLTRCCSLEVHLFFWARRLFSFTFGSLTILTCTWCCQFCRFPEATELHYFRCSVGFLALSSSTTHQQYTKKSISYMHSFSSAAGFGRKQPLPWRNSGDTQFFEKTPVAWSRDMRKHEVHGALISAWSWIVSPHNRLYMILLYIKLQWGSMKI